MFIVKWGLFEERAYSKEDGLNRGLAVDVDHQYAILSLFLPLVRLVYSQMIDYNQMV